MQSNSRPPKSQRPIVMCVMSDLHCGSSVALSPPKITLDDGGVYEASKAQRWLWDCWLDAWSRVEKVRKAKGAELYVVLNGDLVDGQVKNSTQILSGNPTAQAAVVDAALRPMLDLNPDRIVIVRGTEAHVGNSASSEERIASGLKKDKRPIVCDPDAGTASWWHWRADLNGLRVDVTHHGRMGRLPRTRRSNLVLYAWDIFDEHGESGDLHPHLCLRGHNHKRGDSGDAAPVRVVATGAWQLKTAYAHKVAADSLSDIGGILVVIENDGYNIERIEYKPTRPTWRP